jgi:hypothetical protein
MSQKFAAKEWTVLIDDHVVSPLATADEKTV